MGDNKKCTICNYRNSNCHRIHKCDQEFVYNAYGILYKHDRDSDLQFCILPTGCDRWKEAYGTRRADDSQNFVLYVDDVCDSFLALDIFLIFPTLWT